MPERPPSPTHWSRPFEGVPSRPSDSTSLQGSPSTTSTAPQSLPQTPDLSGPISTLSQKYKKLQFKVSDKSPDLISVDGYFDIRPDVLAGLTDPGADEILSALSDPEKRQAFEQALKNKKGTPTQTDSV